MDDAPTVSLARAIGRPALDGKEEGRRVERLPGVHLSLKLGGPVVLQVPQPAGKYAGTVVGFETFAYLIVQARIPQEVLAQLPINTRLVAQHTASGRIFGFRTHLLNRVSTPAPLLFLSFPETVERIALRSNIRVDVNLLGAIQGKYGEHPVMVLDLTPTGCKLSAKVDLKSPLREVQNGDRLVLTCQLAEGAPLVLPLDVRRVALEKGLLYLGGQFADLTSENAVAVATYIDRLLKFRDR